MEGRIGEVTFAPLGFGTMSEPERHFLLRRLLIYPPLWAFSVVAGVCGLDAAVMACKTRELPSEVVTKLADGSWTTAHLPAHGEAVALTWAPRVWRELHPHPKGKGAERKRPETLPLRLLAEKLGMSLPDLHAVRRVLDKYPPPQTEP